MESGLPDGRKGRARSASKLATDIVQLTVVVSGLPVRHYPASQPRTQVTLAVQELTGSLTTDAALGTTDKGPV